MEAAAVPQGERKAALALWLSSAGMLDPVQMAKKVMEEFDTGEHDPRSGTAEGWCEIMREAGLTDEDLEELGVEDVRPARSARGRRAAGALCQS